MVRFFWNPSRITRKPRIWRRFRGSWKTIQIDGVVATRPHNELEKERWMFEVSVDEQFAAAHNQQYYKGKCENLPGQNYKVRFTQVCLKFDEVWLLYDFVHLKQVIQCV